MVAAFFCIDNSEVFHRALADSVYTSEILKRLNKEYLKKYFSLDYINIPKTERQAKDINVGNHMEYLSIEYDNKDELSKSQNIHITRCPICLKKCRKKIKWFSDTSRYVCVAKCEEHGLMEGTINIKKRLNKAVLAEC